LQSIPIIAVSSQALNEEDEAARAAGCDDRSPAAHAGILAAVLAAVFGVWTFTSGGRTAEAKPPHTDR